MQLRQRNVETMIGGMPCASVGFSGLQSADVVGGDRQLREVSMGNMLRSEYWRESARPLTSLVFVAPMMIVYELGVAALGPIAARNGADVWLRTALGSVGLTHHWLLPVLTCGLLITWHHLRGERWQVNGTIFTGMAFESMLFGGMLFVVANLAASLLPPDPIADPSPPVFAMAREAALLPGARGTLAEPVFAASNPRGSGHDSPVAAGVLAWGRLVGYLGAGIYEELLFRLLLLPPLVALLRRSGVPLLGSLAAATVVTSLIFAIAHYETETHILGLAVQWPGEPWHPVSFAFRTLAGGFFAVLFFTRGFGIAAGSHALYDIYVVLL